MKLFTPLSFLVLMASSAVGQTSRPDIIIQYLGLTDLTFTVIGNTGNSVFDPTDLEFHPDLTKNELWVVNRGSATSGGHVVVFSETGEATQSSQSKSDQYKQIYMLRVTGMAFNEDYNFASCSGAYDAWSDGGDPFTGPTLWTGDLTVFGEPGAGDGSHIDDLHQSPYGQGIAWEADNVFWVYDGNMGDLVRYDFVTDHGPGGFGSSDGIVRRFGGLGLQKDTDDVAVSHLAFDYASNWLYVSDYGNHRVIRVDKTTGTTGDTPFFGPFEPLAEYVNYEDFDWEVVIDDTTLNPSGIIVVGDNLLVADHETGDIVVYLTTGPTPFEEWFRIVTDDPGITGLEIGPDGRIFYANEANNKVRRIDSPSIGLEEIEKTDKLHVDVYPNPATGHVNISTDLNLSEAEIVLTDQNGRKLIVQVSHLTDYSASFDISPLTHGIYSLRISSTQGTAVSRLIVK